MRQYFSGVTADPPVANGSAIVATGETLMWNVSQYTPIAAMDGAYAGKIYEVVAGGIVTFASTGTLTITPRYGLTVGAGVSLGASAALSTPGVTTAQPWELRFQLIVRAVGLPGTNSTVYGTGSWVSNPPSAGSLPASLSMGGTAATVDLSVASGLAFGWTLSVAGSVTIGYAYIKPAN